MISFKILTDENKDTVLSELTQSLAQEEKDELYDLISSFDLSDEDTEFAICFSCGCALVRVFDMGRYFFLFPFEISDGADVICALLTMGEYAMREEIPFAVCDVSAENLSCFSGFRHMDVDAEDEECATYRVRIKTECELMEEIPHVVGERVELRKLSPDDITLYAELCKNKNVNKYWGYDYSEDVSDPDDSYFFENAVAEFSRGVAFSMAVCAEGKFVGECTLYAFDGRGSSEFSIRVLPEFQGRGFGTEAVKLLFEVAREIGLLKLRAKVFDKNEASVAMLTRICPPIRCHEGTFEFEFSL